MEQSWRLHEWICILVFPIEIFRKVNVSILAFLKQFQFSAKQSQIPKRNFPFRSFRSIFVPFVLLRRDSNFSFGGFVSLLSDQQLIYWFSAWERMNGFDLRPNRAQTHSVICTLKLVIVFFFFILKMWKIVQNFHNICVFLFDCLEQFHQFFTQKYGEHWLHLFMSTTHFHWANFSNNIFKFNITKFCTSWPIKFENICKTCQLNGFAPFDRLNPT